MFQTLTLKKSGTAACLLLLASAAHPQQAPPQSLPRHLGEAAPEKSGQALRHVAAQAEQWGLTPEDVAALTVTDCHASSTSGLTHVYLRQQVNGIPVRQGLASVHLTPQGEVFQIHNNGLIARLHEKVEATAPALPPAQALSLAARCLNVAFDNQVKLLFEKDGATRFGNAAEESRPDIWVSPTYELNGAGRLRLCWSLVVPDGEDVWEIRLDAVTGGELSRSNRTVRCQFDHSQAFGTSHPPAPSSDLPFSRDCTAQNRKSQTESPGENNLPFSREGPKDQKLRHYPGAAPAPAPAGAAVPAQITNHQIPQSPNPSFAGQYNIFPMPVESPLYGSRSLKTGLEIINATASPYGWHDTDNVLPTPDFGYTRGNNAYAYYAPPGTATNPFPISILRILGMYAGGNVPFPANLNFNYNNSLNSTSGTAFIEDAVTNLFAWNNLCHDVFHLYGFNEAAGNFQQTNATGLGTGTDYVFARAQDGAGLNNASFTTPPENGAANQNPVMRMYLWDTNMPSTILDGDFDNAIIAHEYGHGVSYRLVGGPANVNCLNGFEQGGEGWSDFFGLLLTLQDKDGDNVLEENVVGEGIRTIGAYVLAQAANGAGIRPAPYSTDMFCPSATCNDYTYGDVNNLAAPHGVGFLWCTMLWEMTWELIGQHGFQPDIHNTGSTAGNIRAMKIVVESLKLMPCDPNFPQMRDAILAANTAIYGGENQDLIWAAFARRGLGYSAAAGGSEAFDNPTMRVTKTVNKEEAEVGESVTYTLTVKNNSASALTSVSISDPVPAGLNVTSVSDGGSVQSGLVAWPPVASIPVGGMVTRTFTGTITATSWTLTEYDEPVETVSPPNFAPAGLWLTDCNYPNPATASTRCWWHLDPTVATDASLVLTLNLNGGSNSHLSFWHWFDVEAGVDGGVLERLNGTTWEDLGDRIIKNDYNHIIQAALPTPVGVPIPLTPLSGRRAFSGYSGGYANTIVNLAGFSGSQQVRFRFASDFSTSQNCTTNGPNSGTACEGWYLDDFKLYDLRHLLNTANAASAEGYAESGNVGEVGTIYFAGALPVELLFFRAEARERHIQLDWTTAGETGNAGFELHRRSEFEENFAKTAWEEGKGNWTQKTGYQFLDENVQPNVTYYYRLRQVDFDGRETWSDIAFATIFSEEETVSVFPNPAADGKVFLKFGRQLSEPAEVEVFNAAGQVLLRQRLEEGGSLYPLDCSGLPDDLYFAKIRLKNSVFLHKLVIP